MICLGRHLGKHFSLCLLNMGTRRIMRLDKLSSLVHLRRRNKAHILSRRNMGLLPVFIPDGT